MSHLLHFLKSGRSYCSQGNSFKKDWFSHAALSHAVILILLITDLRIIFVGCILDSFVITLPIVLKHITVAQLTICSLAFFHLNTFCTFLLHLL
jgi:hypothetical protein